jgi:putative flippase GtrA
MLLPLFQWCENSRVGEAIRVSKWLFPGIESIHLLGLVVIAAAVLVVDMRLFGVGLREHPVARLARDMQPWLVGSLCVMLTTGFLLFLSESIKCYYSFPFWIKMTSLALAIIFTFTIHRRVVFSDEGAVSPVWSKVVAVMSVTLWAGVGWGGRWIGFS